MTVGPEPQRANTTQTSTMSGAVPPLELPWPVALRRAALVLWLPTFVPFAAGMLRGSNDSQESYLLCLPLVPGILAPLALRLEEAACFVVAGLVTAALFAGLAHVLRKGPRPFAFGAQLLVGFAITAESIAFAHALRG